MIRVNKENFEEEVLKYKGKVVVEFWSERSYGHEQKAERYSVV